MNVIPDILPVLEAALAVLAGIAVGLANFSLLARNLDLYLEGRPLAAAALQAGRLVAVAAVLLGAVQFGALLLLSCALGLLVARHVILRRAAKVP